MTRLSYRLVQINRSHKLNMWFYNTTLGCFFFAFSSSSRHLFPAFT